MNLNFSELVSSIPATLEFLLQKYHLDSITIMEQIYMYFFIPPATLVVKTRGAFYILLSPKCQLLFQI